MQLGDSNSIGNVVSCRPLSRPAQETRGKREKHVRHVKHVLVQTELVREVVSQNLSECAQGVCVCVCVRRERE